MKHSPRMMSSGGKTDGVSILIARLQNVTNSNASAYMKELSEYLENFSLEKTWGKETIDRDMTSADILWVIIIPVLYFIVVLVTLGLILGYIWYTQNNLRAKVNQSGMFTEFSRTSSRRNNAATTAGSSLKDFFFDSTASQETIGTIRTDSKGTYCGTDSSYKNSHEFSALGQCLAGSNGDNAINEASPHNYLACRLFNTPISLHDSQEKFCSPYRHNITLTSESNSTNSNEDGLNRDNLRASMESHKLIRSCNSKIQPDDTYSWSDTAAQTSAVSGKKSNESRRALHGFQNPVFASDQLQDIHGTLEARIEDPLGFAADRTPYQNKDTSLDLPAVINISSVSITTNYPSSVNIAPSGTQLESGQAKKSAMAVNTYGNETSGVSVGVLTRVGGSLPPLPPNHHHRREVSNPSPGARITKAIQETPSNETFDTGSSDLDKSSLTDSSLGSGILSLPSSIAEFHVSKMQPLNLLKQDGFHMCSQHLTPEQTTGTFATHDGSPRPEDGLSICPNVGSFNQTLDDSLPVGSFLDGSFEVFQDFQCVSASSGSKDGHYLTSSSVTPTGSKSVETDDAKKPSPLIYREGDARMNRLHSLDQLKAGKVSVDQRLRQFGYVRSRSKPKIYTESKSLEVSEVTDISSHSMASSSRERIENLTQEMSMQPEMGEMLSQKGKKLDARPEIVQILTRTPISKTPLQSKDTQGNVELYQQQTSISS